MSTWDEPWLRPGTLGLGFFRGTGPVTAGWPMAGTATNGLIARAILNGNRYLSDGVAEAMHEAVLRSGDIVSVANREIDRIIQAQLLSPGVRLGIHQDVGMRAQAAVINSYTQSFRNSSSESGYRSGAKSYYRRYSGGKLKAALADYSFWFASPNALNFINVELLNRRAAQWMRLNFGAGGAGRGSLPAQQMVIDGMSLGAIGLQEQARPAFTIPNGVFYNGRVPISYGERGSSFYVGGTGPGGRKTRKKERIQGRGGKRRVVERTRHFDDTGVDRSVSNSNKVGRRETTPWVKPQITKGIRGKNFLDRGIVVIANPSNGLLAQYQRAAITAIESGQITNGVDFTERRITVTPKRPRFR